MKKLKIFLAVATAVMLVIAASAFTIKLAVKHNAVLTMHYIEFTGASNNDLGDPDEWVDLGTGAPSLSCNSSNGIVCYVRYNGDFTSFETYVSGKTLSDLQAAGIIQKYHP